MTTNLTLEQAKKLLDKSKMNDKRIYGGGVINGNPETVYLRSLFTKDKLRALLHWMDNPELYKPKAVRS